MKDKKRILDTSWRAKMVEQGIYKDSRTTSNKMIEEMAELIDQRLMLARGVLGSMNKGAGYWVAEALVNLGYQKLPKDSVVLSADEFANLKKYIYEKGSKETAEKIIDLIKTFYPDKKFVETITHIIRERFEIKEN